jgi:hypothetical protein
VKINICECKYCGYSRAYGDGDRSFREALGDVREHVKAEHGDILEKDRCVLDGEEYRPQGILVKTYEMLDEWKKEVDGEEYRPQGILVKTYEMLDEWKKEVDGVRKDLLEIRQRIEEKATTSREKELALARLDEAIMWVAGIPIIIPRRTADHPDRYIKETFPERADVTIE